MQKGKASGYLMKDSEKSEVSQRLINKAASKEDISASTSLIITFA